MEHSRTRLDALLTGSIAPLGSRKAPSGIAKTQTQRPLRLGLTGLEGDAQGDTRNHGGPEKALHHYAFDHYDAWKAELGALPLLDRPGAFGENLSTAGLTEADVAVGDMFRLGTATIEVSQGRQPCWKLNERFGNDRVARRVQSSGRTGWYYRVVEPGMVAPDDALVLIDRKAAEWTIARIWHHFYIDMLNPDALHALSTLAPLAEGWRAYAIRRIEKNAVEDWTRRLTGRDPEVVAQSE